MPYSNQEDLLEDWPHRCADHDENLPARSRTVHFSEKSQLYLYERESLYLLRSLSYTPNDRDRASEDAVQEGRRIKHLINEVPLMSMAASIRYLLHHGIIEKVELIGVEHYCLGTPLLVRMRRRLHEAAVLSKQQNNKEQRQEVESAESSLAKVAQSSSFKCTQRALMRAKMAA